MGNANLNIRDAQLKTTTALPNGAANVSGGAIDLGLGTSADFVTLVNFLLSAPVLNTTQQPDAKTMIYDIIHSVNSDLSSPTTLYPGVLTQTGAGGVGAAAATFQFAVPVNVKRYVGVKATGSAAGNSTTASFSLEVIGAGVGTNA